MRPKLEYMRQQLTVRPNPVLGARRWRLASGIVLLVCLLVSTAPARAQEAWLVTYGPGAEVWELFGHNALWLRDPASGLDHTYSFGYFEIDRPGFHLDFARGIMLYYGASSPVEREFAFYRARQRSISAQRLNLSPSQVRTLQQTIHEAIFPHPQYYAYDYFRNNCSTWLRDLIDQVVDGQLESQLRAEPARLNFRDHTRRMTFDRPWIHTGILLLMGSSLDQPISAWDEAFLPEDLARWLDEIEIEGERLVLETRLLHDPQVFLPPEQARGPWRLMLGVGLLAAILIVVPALGRPRRGSWLPWHLGVFAAGLAGSLLLLMWLASGHHDTRNNWMVLLLHPLWWLLWCRLSGLLWRCLLALLLTGVLAGSLILAWPGLIQDRLDPLMLVLPPLLALLGAGWLGRRPNPP